jgi:CMP-N-acetylneuraminic acid synthetase
MYDGEKILGIIPARSGSRRLPNKNIKILCGKPMISWTLEAALASSYLDTIVFSSDSDEALEIALGYKNINLLRRSTANSSDAATAELVINEVLEHYPGFDYFIYLQPTSPLRLGLDIDNSLKMCIDNNSDTCISVANNNKSPFWYYSIKHDRLIPAIKQESADFSDAYYIVNGALYIFSCKAYSTVKKLNYENAISYVMPLDRSLDIDTQFDFDIAEFILNKRN